MQSSLQRLLVCTLRSRQAPSISPERGPRSADECPNVFVRRGRAKQIEFAALSDQHGGGFIVEADRLRGKFARCKIKSRKEDGDTVNIIAGCATDIMLSNVQFSLKVLEPNKISRIFPGMEDMAISYHRCPI